MKINTYYRDHHIEAEAMTAEEVLHHLDVAKKGIDKQIDGSDNDDNR